MGGGQLTAANMNYLTCAFLVLGLLSALISAYPSTVVVNGRCLTCDNPDGDRVYIGGQEYRSFSSPNSNVIVSPPNNNRGSSTVYHRGGNTVVNGRCEICNVDI